MMRVVWMTGLAMTCVATQGSAQSLAMAYTEPVRPVHEQTPRHRVNLKLDNVTLGDAIQTIAEQSGVVMVFSPEQLPARRITYTGSNVPVEDALREVLRNTGMELEPVNGIGYRLVAAAKRVEGIIVGRVVHAKTKQPVTGATVTLDENAQGTSVNADGTFRISTAAGEHTLHVRALGFSRTSKRVTVVDGTTMTADIVLEPSASVLNEVIVTGTVVATTRKEIPNPITVITAEDIEKRGITRVEQFFRGEVPGLLAAERGTMIYSDALGSMNTAEIYSRGASSLDGGPNPIKTFIDGVELLDPSYLGTIDPQSIERIEIVTGPQAATIYGSGAMGGVMQIFTKKGKGRTTPDITVSLRYGFLESNMSSAKTPSHQDAITMTGGLGSQFSYSANVSYNYTGQWQPKLYNRRYGASLGATHTAGPVTASGSFSTTGSGNGMYRNISPKNRELRSTGEWYVVHAYNNELMQKSLSQTATFNLDIRGSSVLQHHFTVGRSQTNFDIIPERPTLGRPADTLYAYRSSTGSRTTMNYSATIVPSSLGIWSQTLVLGVNGSTGGTTRFSGSVPGRNASSYTNPRVSKSMDTESWGGYANWQTGFFRSLYFTFGLRAERNPSYGRDHKIDWTPTNGVAYTIEYQDLTIKLLGSYGRATRAPNSSYRDEVIYQSTGYDPVQYTSQFAAPDLTPEYERGPQGGIELYYGNRASVTVNRYSQRVTDLIQQVVVDTIRRVRLVDNAESFIPQYQYQNVANIRKYGWEATGNLNLGSFGIKGTYSWNDSRILSVSDKVNFSSYVPGQVFANVPSHTANVTATYAHGGTSLSFVTNYVGTTSNTRGPFSVNSAHLIRYNRLQAYIERSVAISGLWPQPGYMKSDLAASHRIRPWITGTVNITNLGNGFGSEETWYNPSLGRVTTLGLSLRFPRR